MDMNPKFFEEIRKIEYIVTCYIHNGIMKDPRKLSCQHAFCYECLQGYFQARGDIVCSICRSKETISYVDQLPEAFTEKKIIDVIMKHKLYECVENLTVEIKNILQQLSKDIHVNNENLFLEEHAYENPSLGRESANDLEMNMMHIENYRENMKEDSKYELVKQVNLEDLSKSLYRNGTGDMGDFARFDIEFSSNNPDSHQIVLVEGTSNKVLVYSGSSKREFYIKLNGKIIQPEYIRILRGNLIMSGRFKDHGVVQSVFLHCTMDGIIVCQSEFFPWPDLLHLPMMLGFDINIEDNKYYVCLPKSRKIITYDTSSFVSYEEHYEFHDDSQPEYVAFCHTSKQLFISCPRNKRILVLNLESGSFKTITTDPIMPKMIFMTEEDKLIFLDSTMNRLVWMKRLGDDILTRILHLPFISGNVNIKDFRVSRLSGITVTTEIGILMYQQAKYASGTSRFPRLCNVL